MKKENLNVRSKWVKTPFVLGLSAALCMPTAMLYANDGDRTSSDAVLSVLQSRTITGQILDEFGEPMIGVSVVVKGASTVGTITDFDGNYSLEVPSGQKVLVLSYIGYKTQEVTIGSGNVINVKMEPDTQALDEVVVIGYGTMKKRDLTGAVTSVKSEDITLNPGSNPMEALQGKVAGLDITRESGQAGSGVKMQLRGNRSFSASGNPLFIIDGMPGDYATLNPNDIESIEVLKDASSTAVYGASGANGVVIITTKQGKEGKLTANFNAFIGFNNWATLPEVRQGEEYMEILRQAKKNAGTYVDDASMFTNPAYYNAYKSGKFIDWTDEILGAGYTQNYSLSLSGGTEKTKAYMSLNFSDEKGQYKDDNYKVYSTNIRVDHKLNNYVSAGVNMQASYVHQNRPFAKIQDGMNAIPYGDLYDENGNYTQFPIEGEANYLNLLMNNKGNYRNQNQNFKMYINPYIRITPFKGFTWESRINGTLTYSKNNAFQGVGSYNVVKKGDNWETDTEATITQNRSYNYKWENILTYNFTVAQDHDFTVTAVTSWNHNQADNTQMKGVGIKNNKSLWTDLGNAVTASNSSSYTMSKGMGYIGRLNYSYLGKYLFSASVRHDGSSVLADGHKWSTFPAVSLGWRISEENFMENTRDWLSNLKLRLSYGETGTASINPYSSVASLTQNMFTLGGQLIQPTYTLTETIANQALTWERSKSINAGIDASFLNNRINVTLDYYNTDTEGVIWQKSLPVVNGAFSFNTPYKTNVNLAETNNKGVEIAVNTENIVTQDFRWSSALTFSYNKEEITKLTGTENDVVINGDYAYALGESVNSYRHFKLNGIWKESEAAEAAIFGQEPGHIKIDVPGLKRHEKNGSVYYTKVNAEGEEQRYDAANPYALSADDYQIIGHNTPDWSLGFQNTLTWKNFDLSVYMYMRWGQMIKYDLLTDYDPAGNLNFPSYFMDHVGSYFPSLDANVTDKLSQYTGFSALSYVDGSFFKVKNVTLGYTLPDLMTKKAGIEKLRVYATLTNPLVIAKNDLLQDYDPEMNGSLNYPLTKQLVFGVNVTF